MLRSLPRTVAAFVAVAMTIAACSSAAPTTAPTLPPGATPTMAPSLAPGATPTVAPSLAPGATPTEAPAASQAPASEAATQPPASASPAPASQPAGESSAPTFALPSFALPSFTPDTTLEALFPKTIDGNPVKVLSFHASDLTQLVESTAAEKARFQALLTTVGVPLSNVTIAIATVMLGGSARHITGVRVQGVDQNALLQGYLSYTISGKSVPSDWAVGSTTIGGKTVATLTDTADSSEAVEYGYPYGEVIFDVSGTDAATAAKLIGALP